MKKQHRFIILFLSGLLFLSGCAVEQKVDLRIDGTGSLAGEVRLHPVLAAYLTDLSMAASSGGGEIPLFDLPRLEEAFSQSTGVVLTELSSPRREVLRFGLRLEDLNAPFEALPRADRNIIEFRRRGDEAVLDLVLTRENFTQVSAFFPALDQGLLDYFIPQGESFISEDLYKEDLAYALEDYLEGYRLDQVLEDSVIEIAIDTGGRVVSQKGGRLSSGGGIFSIPLLKVLLLNQPLEYQLVFLPR